MRGHDELVAVLAMLVLPVVLDRFAQNVSLRIPEHEPAPRLVLDVEELELGSELAMIPPLRLLAPDELLLEIFLA